MIKILFVCHGNICRSPMAEFVFKNLVEERNLSSNYQIASAATSNEEIGNDIYPAAKDELIKNHISYKRHNAVCMKKSDYSEYDIIVAMESYNIKNIMRIIKDDPDNKVKRLLDFTDRPANISDPWYSGNFSKTFEEIMYGCIELLKKTSDI